MSEEKILKDEVMSDEELENVAGGNRDELALDTQLFNAMGGRIKAYDLDDITNTNVRGIAGRINSLYGELGIQVEYKDLGASSYTIDGRPASRNDVVKTALFRAGYHKIDPSQFQIK